MTTQNTEDLPRNTKSVGGEIVKNAKKTADLQIEEIIKNIARQAEIAVKNARKEADRQVRETIKNINQQIADAAKNAVQSAIDDFIQKTSKKGNGKPQIPAEPKTSYSVPEAAVVCGISRSSLYKEIGAGNLKTTKFGAKTMIFPDDLADFIAAIRTAQ